jgi:diguanylate cyclase (GGDEF)-like protein/PAS domain S-box-containing protein
MMDSGSTGTSRQRFARFGRPAGADPETQFRAELVLGFGLFEVVVTVLAGASEIAWGTAALGAVYAGGLVPILATLAWLRRGGDPSTIATVLVAIVYGLLAATNLATGGRALGANMALPTVALFAILVSTRRMGVFWVLMVIAQIVVVAFLRRSAIDFPIRPEPHWVASAIDRVPLYFTLGSAVIGGVVLRAIDHYRTRLAQAKAGREEALARVARSAERFTDFAEVAADGFWETDAALRLTYVSPSFAGAMGLYPEQMIGLTPIEAYRLRFPDAAGADEFMVPLLQHAPFREQLLITRDEAGQRHWLLNQGRPLLAADGQFAGYRGAVRDVTRQRIAEQALRASEERLRLITEHVPALIAYLDQEQRYRYCNARVGQVLGVDAQSLIGRTMREVRGEAIYAALAAHVARALAGEVVTFEGSGSWGAALRHFQTSYIPDRAADGRVAGFYSVTFDITEIKQSQLALAEATRRLRLIADNLPVAIAHVDADHRFTFNNRTHSRWLGRPLEDLAGRHFAEVHPPDVLAIIGPQLERAFVGERTTFDFVAGPRSYRATYVPEVGPGGAVVGVFGLIHDVTKIKQVEDELRVLAQFDPLTGLANRRRYNERLADAIARSERSGEPMGLMFLDLDRFKPINDQYGHRAGDLVLQEFARRIGACTRRTDTVARLAGDEFVIILEPLASTADAEGVARKIIAALAEPFTIEGRALVVSASIGIALRRPGEVDGEALLRRADAALYAVKARERGAYHIGLESDPG